MPVLLEQQLKQARLTMCYLIDGYNSLHMLLPGVVEKRGNEEARREFLQMLAPYMRKVHPKKVIIVFDSPSQESCGENSRHFRIIFAPPPSADEWIKNTVKNGGKYIVVTDDNEVRDFARSVGVPSQKNHTFYSSIGLLKPMKKSRPKPEINEQISKQTAPELALIDEADAFGMNLSDKFDLSRKKKQKK